LLEILQKPNNTKAMMDEFLGDADADGSSVSSEEAESSEDEDGDVKMIRSVLDKADAKKSKAKQSSRRKKKRLGKVASRRKVDVVLRGKDDDVSSDEEDRIRVIDGALVKLMQTEFQCSDNSDSLARQNFEDFGAFSLPFKDEGGRIATMVAMVAANATAVKINGSGTQIIDFARACLDNGSVGTS
jgi:hypothetical protein